MSKSRYQLDLEHRIHLIEQDLDANGRSKHLEIERSLLLDSLNEYLAEKANRQQDERKDEK